MPYTADPTDVAAPANTGVAASTAAAEFRALKLYIRDTILAPLNLKRAQTDLTFSGNGNFNTGNLNVQLVCTAQQGFQVPASGGYQASGYTGIGLKVGPAMSVGWSAVGASVTQLTSLNTAVTIDAYNGNIITADDGVSDTYYSFVVNNPKVAGGDLVVIHQISGVAKQFRAEVTNVVAGQFTVKLYCYPSAGGSTFVATLGFAVLSRT